MSLVALKELMELSCSWPENKTQSCNSRSCHWDKGIQEDSCDSPLRY